MLSGGYWSHLQKNTRCLFPACWQILIPYSRLSRIYKTDLRDFSARVCPIKWEIVDVRNFEISKITCFENVLGVFLELFRIIWTSKIENNWFGEAWTRPKIRKARRWGLFVFPEINRKVISPKWSRIILRSFWANLLIEFTIEMARQTPPLRPQIQIFLDFQRGPLGNPPLFDRSDGRCQLLDVASTWLGR